MAPFMVQGQKDATPAPPPYVIPFSGFIGTGVFQHHVGKAITTDTYFSPESDAAGGGRAVIKFKVSW